MSQIDEAHKRSLDLVRLNQARILAGTGSPKVLIGGINLSEGPNFHTEHMIEMGASIVSISVQQEQLLRPDRLYCALNEILPSSFIRLPDKWRPDFFYDAQAEQGHYFPVGLGDLDIPTVVSFNHAHLGQALLHMQGLFDCIVAPSKSMAHWGDVVLPWGASWGTMESRIELFGKLYAGEEKPVTVSCTIGTTGIGKESIRFRVLDEMKTIKARRPDWNVVIASGLKQAEYFDLLAKSKVSVNVGSWGSSMTYRPLEIIAQEAILVHADENAYGSKENLVHAPFYSTWYKFMYEPWSLEGDIEEALSMQKNCCAPRIKSEVREMYSYERQYRRLFDVAASIKKKPKLDTKAWSRRAFAINYLTGYPSLAKVHEWALTPEDKASLGSYKDRDWDISLWSPRDQEERYRWQTDLARREEDPKAVYRRYAQ